jgi:hypothetical protein
MKPGDRLRLYQGWSKAVASAKGWVSDD